MKKKHKRIIFKTAMTCVLLTGSLVLTGYDQKKEEEGTAHKWTEQSNEIIRTECGQFKSKQGVLSQISCYCNNGGYLEFNDKEKLPICFENTDKVVSCKNICVKGTTMKKRIAPEPTNACKAGEMEYFKVLSYECQ